MKTYYHLISIIICTFFVSLSTQGQWGNPFITDFQPLNIVDQHIYCIEHNEKNIMFFGTTQGVLIFNSETWELINTPNSVFSMKYLAENNTLYVGMKGGFGYIKKDANGLYKFIPLSSNIEFGDDFNQILFQDELVIFKSGKNLHFINYQSNKLLNTWTSENENLEELFFINEKLHVLNSNNEIIVFEDDSVVELNIAKVIEDGHIVFAKHFNDSNALIGLNNGTLFLFNGSTLNLYEYEDREYVKASIINNGIILDDQNIIILSTLAGGIVICNQNDGTTKNIINFQSGLPDDEVFSIGFDHSGGIWVSHIYGVSRIDLTFPVQAYHSFPGLSGNIFSLYKNDTTLFIGTTEGLFFYAKEKHFDEEERIRIVKVRVPVKKEMINENNAVKKLPVVIENEIKEPDKNEDKSNGILSKWFKRRDRIDENNHEDHYLSQKEESFLAKVFTKETKKEEPQIQENKEVETTYTIQRKRVKEKIYRLQSVTYHYKKINGFDEKIKNISPFGSTLLLSTNIGLYEFDGNSINNILEDAYIKSIYIDSMNEKALVLSSRGLFELYYEKGELKYKLLMSVDIDIINNVTMDGQGQTWLGGDGEVLKVDQADMNKYEILNFQNIIGPIIPFFDNEGSVKIYNKGIIYEQYGDSLQPIQVFENTDNINLKIYKDYNHNYWATNGDLWKLIRNDYKITGYEVEKFLGVFDDINDIIIDDQNNVWVIDEYKEIYKLNASNLSQYIQNFELIIHYIINKKGIILPPENIELSYNDNFVEVNISAPFFVKYKATQYSYRIEGLTDMWSKWMYSSTIQLPYLPSGNYTLQLRAKNIFGYISDIKSIEINILPPFWKKKVFYVLIFLFFGALIFLYIKYRERKLKKERRVLEEKVVERTQEIENQKNKIEKQAIEITDSITYAKRIQEALLPSQDILRKMLKDYFILFKPRDIVSGDFYWAHSDRNHLFLAAADCTGHGVPGAFMSMLGITFFNELVKKENQTDPGKILNNVRSKIIESLTYNDGYAGGDDGMDVSFCSVDLKQMMIHFAGAYNPLYVIKNKDDETLSSIKYNKEKSVESDHNKILIQINADRIPVSNSLLNKEKFNTHKIPYRKGDIFYIFSDGFSDQYGGEQGRKYFSRNLRQLLLSICDEPMEVQKKMLDNEFVQWKGNNEQLDDVLIIGFRII